MDQRESMMLPGSGPYYSSGFQPSPSMNSLSHFQPNTGGNFFGSIAPLDNSATMSPHRISMGPPPPAVSVGPPPTVLQGEPPVRRKRGRPRKYGREGAASLTLSPSTSSSMPIVGTNPKRRGRPPGPGRKQQIVSIALIILPGGHPLTGAQNMTPHVIIVAPGEDVIRKIKLFARGWHSTIILTCNGSVSTVNTKFPNSGEIVTYEGLFDIVSLSGSYNNAPHGLVGSLNLAMAGPDCNIIGGVVDDVMVAASPVQLVVATLSPKAPKTKTNTGKSPKASADPADRTDDDFGSPAVRVSV